MISKYLLPVFALAAVFLVVAVPYSSAAGHELVEHSIRVNINPENADQYDKIVNLADPATAITNPDTWTPSPQGIWTGASVEESLFRFDKVMDVDNRFHLYSAHMFNSTEVMNGASTTIIRSPIASDGVKTMSLTIYATDDPEWDIRDPVFSGAYLTDNDAILAAEVEIDMTDTSIVSGSDAWTVDGRTYVKLHGPIYSDIYYVFCWVATYEPNARPAIYVSGQDICGDNITNTAIGIYSKAGDIVYSKTYRYAIDPGISWDMLEGLGNGMFAKSFWMDAGDSISMMVKSGSYGIDQNLWHTVMIPFATADGDINATVVAYYKLGDNWVKAWEDSRTQWNGYILACSDMPIRLSSVRDVKVVVTMNHAERVNWMFIDSSSESFSQSYVYNNAILSLDGIEHKVQARPYASYQLSIQEIFMPSLDPADFLSLVVEPKINQPHNSFAHVIGQIMYGIGEGMIKRGIVIAPAIMLMQGGAALMVVNQYLASRGIDLPSPQDVVAIFVDAVNAIRDALDMVGAFLLDVGQAIYDALVWFADAVMEYGSVLLGLLIIAVALALFFAPIYTQLKLWGIAWRMAEGDVQAAAAQAQDLASQASGVMSKFRRH
jgi:hypothetical protein